MRYFRSTMMALALAGVWPSWAAAQVQPAGAPPKARRFCGPPYAGACLQSFCTGSRKLWRDVSR